MFQFFVGSFSYVRHFYIKVKGTTRQRMISIDNDFSVFDFNYSQNQRTFLCIDLKSHPDFNFISFSKFTLLNALYQAIIAKTIGIHGLNGDLEFVTFAMSFKGTFESRYNIARAMKINE